MEICDKCGATKYKYGFKFYCPNCDEKPDIKSKEEDDNLLGYIS